MPKVLRMFDEYERPQKLIGMSDFLPSARNPDPQAVRVPSEWLAEQVCEDHPYARDVVSGKGFTAVRTKWKRSPENSRLWGIAVQFVCPVDQVVWEKFFRPK